MARKRQPFSPLLAPLAVAFLACAGPPSAPRAPPPAFVDERRLPPTELEAKQKAEAERLQAQEAEARQKAEDERRKAAEAEARQKAEEERRQAAEVEARQKADAERRQAAEAEARQKAESERRRAAEDEARLKAEAERRRTPATPAPAATRAASDCGADQIGARAISGGRIVIEIAAPCRANAPVVLRYGPFEFIRQLDSGGRISVQLDLFQGKTASVSLQVGDGPRQPVSLDAVDLGGLSKVAVVWRAPVNLDLHVYEYAALPGTPGHVWAGSPSSAETAESETRSSRRGHGFLSSADDGRGAGDHVEVYTFWHHADQQAGLVATALDYETRGAEPAGETCGNGAHASLVYDTFQLGARGQVLRERGTIVAATCGAQLSGAGRFMEDAVPDIDARP